MKTKLKILKVPNTILKTEARKVEEDEFGLELEEYMNSMLDTMFEQGGIGLSAPQIGDSRRILVAEPPISDDSSENPLFMMVNPEITRRSEDLVGYDGGECCLSIPNFLFTVPRHKTINVRWQTPYGILKSRTLTDVAAIVIQHEIDHLDGITLLERTTRPHRRKYLRKLKKENNRKRR